MNVNFQYAVSYLLAILLISSTAGSLLYLCIRLFRRIVCKRWDIVYYYSLLRAAVFFSMIPAVLLTVIAIFSRNHMEWGVLSPEYGVQVVTYQDYFGIMMIDNLKLNAVRVGMIYIWLAGFLFFLLKLLKGKYWLKKIRTDAREWEEEWVNKIREQVMKEAGTDKKIRVWQSGRITMPFSAGIVHPEIYFPETEIAEQHLYYILKHEYIHCIRKDLILHLFMTLVKAIHWYHPVIWFLEREFCNYSELSCDEEVLSLANKDERYEYAQLILAKTETVKTKRQYAYMAGFISRDEKDMKERITYIMRGSKSKKITKAAFLSAVLLFTGLCPGVTYAASQGFSVVNGYISQVAEETITTYQEMEEFTAYNGHEVLTEEEILELEEVPLLTGERAAIDVTIAGNGRSNLRRAALKKGDKVRVVLTADRLSDAFYICLLDINSGVTSTVYSRDGAVSYVYEVDQTSDYLLYVQGKNGVNGSRIHISGSIING